MELLSAALLSRILAINYQSQLAHRWLFVKMLRLMRLTAFIMIAFSLHVSATGVSQNVTLNVKDASLNAVFKTIKRQTSYTFFFNEELLEKSEKVTVNLNNVPLQLALEACFSNQPFTYSIEGKMITIEPRETNKDAIPLKSPILEIPPITVRGRIVNEKGEPVIASVTIKGSNRGTTSDADGNFVLENVDENAELIISSANTETTTIKINNRTVINISVRSSVSDLDAVVINKGYYSESRKLSTGNVARVDAKTIEKQPVGNVLQAIQGRMAGVVVQQQAGLPGAGINIQIRGRNSIRPDGNYPLYLVDGVPYPSSGVGSDYSDAIIFRGNPLSSINPSDIESIEILKDADATAIYGSRGANGVVLITTKKAASGKSRVDINIYSGAGKVGRKIDLLNTEQYREMRKEAFKNDNRNPGSADYDINGTWDSTRYTDWQKTLLGRTMHQTNAQASISGGNKNVQYLVSGNFYRESTVFPGDFNDDKYSGRFYLNHNSDNQKFMVRFSGSYLVDDNRLPTSDLTNAAMTLAPNAPSLYTSDGKLNWENNTWNNPLGYTLENFNSRTHNFTGNTLMSYEIITGLQLKANFGYTEIGVDERYTSPKSASRPNGSEISALTVGTNNIQTWIVEPQIAWKKQWGKAKLNTTAGLSFQQTKSRNELITGTGFASESLINNILAATTITPVSSGSSLYRYQAGFARMGFDWDDKYLINLTGRRDGSSRFGPGKQFANFGAVGFGWIFSNETWMKEHLPFMSFGKIRGSVGTTGSDQIGNYGYYDLWVPNTYPYAGAPGLHPNNLFNPDYGWEVNRKLEIGLELGFLRDRINISASYFRNRSGSQLVGLTLPSATGFTSVSGNLPAEVENTGLELEAAARIVSTPSFTWSSSANITFPRNKLLSYPDLKNSAYARDYVEGQSLFVYPALHYIGVDSVGKGMTEDVNKNGNSTEIPADYQYIKSITQDFYGGWQNEFTYKGFQLNIFFQFVKQQGRTYRFGNSSFPGQSGNQPVYVLDRWQQPGDQTDIPIYTTRSYRSRPMATDAIIGDASFIRLKNISLAYNLPEKWNKKISLAQSQVYLSGQNVLTITDYKGLDPETQSMQSVPPLCVIVAGIKLTF